MIASFCMDKWTSEVKRSTGRDVRDAIARALPAMDDLRARIAARAGGEIEESVPLIREDRER